MSLRVVITSRLLASDSLLVARIQLLVAEHTVLNGQALDNQVQASTLDLKFTQLQSLFCFLTTFGIRMPIEAVGRKTN